jgi:hypothetical protein
MLCVGFAHRGNRLLRETLRTQRAVGIRLLIPEGISELEIVAPESKPIFQIAILVLQVSRLPLQVHQCVIHVHQLLLRFEFRGALSDIEDRLASGCNRVKQRESCCWVCHSRDCNMSIRRSEDKAKMIDCGSMDEGRKRVLLIAACILAARKIAQYDGPTFACIGVLHRRRDHDGRTNPAKDRCTLAAGEARSTSTGDVGILWNVDQNAPNSRNR